MAGNFNKVREGAQPCKMPMVRGGPRWSPDIIMEEVGCWSTYYKMPVPMESPRLSFAIIMEEVGCWSTY